MSESNQFFIEEITDSKEVMHAAAPPIARWFITIVFIAAVSIIVFLFFFQRDVAISAQGIIAPSKLTESVVSVSGGRVISSKVGNGSFVNAGDVLIELDVSYAEQQLEIFKPRLADAGSKAASLKTLKSSYEQDVNLLEPDDPYYSKFLEYFTEKSIIIENGNIGSSEAQQVQQSASTLIAFYQSRIDSIDSRINELIRLQGAIAGSQPFSSNDAYVQAIHISFSNEYTPTKHALDDAITSCAKMELDFANGSATQEELDAAKAIVDAAKLQLDSLLVSYNTSIQAEIEKAQSQKTAYEDQIAQLNSQNSSTDTSALPSLSVDQLKAQKISEVEAILETAQKEIESYQLQIIELEKQIKDGVVVANITGVVMFEDEVVAGEIIQPGTTVLFIVPDNNEYKVTLYVLDKDIAKVKGGETALLSVNAFPYQEYGRLRCTISYVSVTSVTVENVGQIYKVEAVLPENALVKKDGTQYEISAGMTVEADVVYGTESWITWLLREINLVD